MLLKHAYARRIKFLPVKVISSSKMALKWGTDLSYSIEQNQSNWIQTIMHPPSISEGANNCDTSDGKISKKRVREEVDGEGDAEDEDENDGDCASVIAVSYDQESQPEDDNSFLRF